MEESLSYFLKESKNLDVKNLKKNMKIALLSSFTINGLTETLQVKCSKKNISCKTYLGGYDQYAQEILSNNSKLYNFKPDLTFLFLDLDTFLGNFSFTPYSIENNFRKDHVKEIIDKIINLIKTFKINSNSKIVISNFNIPKYSPYGIFETKTNFGYHEMIKNLNLQLMQEIQQIDDVFLYDFNQFVHFHGEKNIIDRHKILLGDIKISLKYIPHLATDLMGYVIGLLGLSKKCIVLDLDNTLWGGIIGEDGFNNIQLGPQSPGNAYVEFQRHLLALNQRGIILAINSKNNSEDAIKVIREHPYMILKEENFACIKINWNDKVSNMKEIATELNIDLDSFVFFDDDPINREFVKMALPQVTTIDLPQDPVQYTAILCSLNDFNALSITSEDSKRSKMYVEQQKRIELQSDVSNLDDFLKQLEIKITIKNVNESTISRISQLTLKTNQFNLSTKRYQEDEIRKLTMDDMYVVGCIQVEDKFGDNGITGVYVVRKDNPTEWIIDTFLLSCRVMGREVEKEMMGNIVQQAKKEGILKLKSQYIETEKNIPCKHFLKDCGFKKEGNNWFFYLDHYFKNTDFIEVLTESK
jgi:FkbH-like protein